MYTNYKEYENNEKSDDEIYQLVKDQKLKNNKKFRPFCLCPPDVMFVTHGSKNSLLLVFDSLSNLDCENKGNPFVDLFFFVFQEVISVNFTGL